MLNDGAVGLRTISDHGRTTLVQNPAEAQFPTMPINAIRTAQPDHVATATELGYLVASLTRQHAKP
jgi:two-component system chemotaxis response regulator CheB